MVKPEDCVLVRLFGDSVTDCSIVADALARCEVAHLFDLDGRAVWVRDGEFVQVNGLVLRELAGKFVVTKSLVMRDGRPEVEFVPVVLDERMVRAILLGNDPNPRTGGELRGGSFVCRLPKVSAAAIGLAA
jgi:hypothetical protein